MRNTNNHIISQDTRPPLEPFGGTVDVKEAWYKNAFSLGLNLIKYFSIFLAMALAAFIFFRFKVRPSRVRRARLENRNTILPEVLDDLGIPSVAISEIIQYRILNGALTEERLEELRVILTKEFSTRKDARRRADRIIQELRRLRETGATTTTITLNDVLRDNEVKRVVKNWRRAGILTDALYNAAIEMMRQMYQDNNLTADQYCIM
jgi:hypothetical protein